MSKLSKAISDLVDTIRSISGPPVYENAIQNASGSGIDQVEDFARPLLSIPDDQFPHFNVVYKGEEKIKEPGHFKSIALIEIQCAFRNTSESEITSWLSDIEIALSKDFRRNTSGVHEGVIKAIEQDDGSVHPHRLLKIIYELTYSYQQGQP